MTTPTPPSYNKTITPKKSPNSTTSFDTLYWNDATKCVEGNMGDIKLISTSSDLYLPIQYVNSFVPVLNISGSAINIFFPTSDTSYGKYFELLNNGIIYIQFLFNSYPTTTSTLSSVVSP